MTAPEWVTSDFFQHILQQSYDNKDIKINKITHELAVPKGENYTSDLYRTTLLFTENKGRNESEISVIVKCGSEDDIKQDLSKKLNIFEKESEMFSKTFPAIHNILGGCNILSPKCLYSSLQPHSIIVLEDLKVLKYQVLPRQIGFGLEISFTVIQKMAQLHAASVIMYQKDPSLVTLYNEPLLADNSVVRPWVKCGYKELIKTCNKWIGFEKYGSKLKCLGDEAMKRSFTATNKKRGGFQVLNHGDLWTNNLMFRYDENGKVEDMRFIDFQFSYFGSPAIDLHYFIVTSTNVKDKIENIDIILDFYYANLILTLTRLKCSLKKIPSRRQLEEDYISRAYYGFTASITALPLVLASSRTDASFENVLKDDSVDGFRFHIYNNDNYRQHMEVLLPYYDDLGIFD